MTNVMAPVFEAATGTIVSRETSVNPFDLFSGVTADDVISGTATAFGALSSFRAAQFDEQRFQMQSDLETFRGRQEALKGRQETVSIRDRLIRTLARNNAAAGASGIDLSSGSVRGGIEGAIRSANREISVTRSNAALKRAARLTQARQLRLEAKAARARGSQDVFFGLLDHFQRSGQRDLLTAAATASRGTERGRRAEARG